MSYISIWMYTGTPGSGKSYHAARMIVGRLKRGGGLIANFPVNEDFVKKRKTSVQYWDNSEMTVERFVAYALEHHKIGKEGQTLVVIDECQVIFNCRDFGRKDRNAWVNFFAQHRKLGFNIILITQSDRMIDKQIRSLVEEEVKHRKLNNFGFGGMVISLTMRSWFIAISYWYGGNKLVIGKEIFSYHKKYENVYDSYRMFTDMAGGLGTGVCAGGNREAVGPQGTAPETEAPVVAEEQSVDAKGDSDEQCEGEAANGVVVETSGDVVLPCRKISFFARLQAWLYARVKRFSFKR